MIRVSLILIHSERNFFLGFHCALCSLFMYALEVYYGRLVVIVDFAACYYGCCCFYSLSFRMFFVAMKRNFAENFQLQFQFQFKLHTLRDGSCVCVFVSFGWAVKIWPGRVKGPRHVLHICGLLTR